MTLLRTAILLSGAVTQSSGLAAEQEGGGLGGGHLYFTLGSLLC